MTLEEAIAHTITAQYSLQQLFESEMVTAFTLEVCEYPEIRLEALREAIDALAGMRMDFETAQALDAKDRQ